MKVKRHLEPFFEEDIEKRKGLDDLVNLFRNKNKSRSFLFCLFRSPLLRGFGPKNQDLIQNTNSTKTRSNGRDDHSLERTSSTHIFEEYTVHTAL